MSMYFSDWKDRHPRKNSSINCSGMNKQGLFVDEPCNVTLTAALLLACTHEALTGRS